MDKIRFSSFKFKVWEDKVYKLERQRAHAAHLHIDDIKIENSTRKAADTIEQKANSNEFSGLL